MSENFLAEYSDNEPVQTKTVEPEVKKEDKPAKSENTYQELQESLARPQGWAPKEEWKGDPNEWVSAEVFNARGPLFDKIKAQKDDIISLRAQMDGFSKQQKVMLSIMEKTRADERKKVLAELQQKKVKFMEDGDYAGAVKTDSEIKEAEKEPETETVSQQIDQEGVKLIKEFTTKNKWYYSDHGLREYADHVGRIFMAENPNAKYTDVIRHMEESTKESFPEKFQNTQPRSPVASQGDNLPGKQKKKVTMRDLDDDHRDILKGYIENNATKMSDQEYAEYIIKEWQEIGEIS